MTEKKFEFTEGYDEGFYSFNIGILLKKGSEDAGLTQDKLAKQLNTKKRRFQELKIIRKI